MRDLMMLGVMALLVPMSLGNTLVAYLLWGWSAVMAPNTWVYGFMQTVGYNQIFAIIALVRILLFKEVGKTPYVFSTTAVLFLLLGIQGILSATFAYPDLPRNWELATNLLKALLFCLVMPLVITSRYRMHLFILFIVIGLSVHGVIEGLKFGFSGGAHHIQGNSKLGDNNHFAISIAMCLPMMLYLARYASYKLTRICFLLGALVVLFAVIGTHSRGGFISLVAMGIWVAVTSRKKIFALVIMVVIGWALFALAPESWTDRMDTIQTAEQDSSFMGRVIAWRAGSAVALDNPFLGGGFHATQVPHIWAQFSHSPGLLGFVSIPDPGNSKAAHSIFFEILGDLGFVGFAIFLFIILRPFYNHWRISRLIRKSPGGFEWVRGMSHAIVSGMIVYIIGGAGVSMAYYEVMYMLAMLSEIIKMHLEHQFKSVA